MATRRSARQQQQEQATPTTTAPAAAAAPAAAVRKIAHLARAAREQPEGDGEIGRAVELICHRQPGGEQPSQRRETVRDQW